MDAPIIPLLINPSAGRLYRKTLVKWLRRHQRDFHIIETSSAHDLHQQARRLADAGEPIIAVSGGDGSLMCAAESIIGSESALGIIPSGSMNVFARELGIGSRSLDRALRAMREGETRMVDIFSAQGKPFLQLAGIGLDARIVELITPKQKRQLGPAAHIIPAYQVSRENHPLLSVKFDSGEIFQGQQVMLGNGKRYGGEAHLFAHALLDDGMLEMAVIQHSNAGILLEILIAMVLQGASAKTTSRATQLAQIRSCEISTTGKVPYQLDGDFAGHIYPEESLKIAKLPQQLKVCIPKYKRLEFKDLNALKFINELKRRLTPQNPPLPPIP